MIKNIAKKSISKHKKAVLKLFLTNKGYSCTEIARKVNLSNTAVSTIIDEFISKKIIVFKNASLKTDMGRPSLIYQINDFAIVASLDFTDVNLHITISNTKLEQINKIIIKNCNVIKSSTIEMIFLELKEFLKTSKYSKFAGICIGTPGIINNETGYFDFAPKFENYKNINLEKIFKDQFDCPIIVENDIKLALYAESLFGTCINQENAIMLNINDHYGGAIKINNKIYYGKNKYAGEFGSVRVLNKDNNFKYLSYIISFGGMTYSYKQKTNVDLTIDEFIKTLLNGEDKIANEILNNAINYTAVEIVNISNVFGCDFFVLNGVVAELGTKYLDSLNNYINCLNDVNSQSISIKFSNLAGKAVAMGGTYKAVLCHTYNLLESN